MVRGKLVPEKLLIPDAVQVLVFHEYSGSISASLKNCHVPPVTMQQPLPYHGPCVR